ncbi:flavodoxin family protein [Methanoculleus oceani]|uniref:Flavodoxin family protein n=1 Tax=Methanoculleus oceani TaxID=2184756 RepID=A0ABD4TEK1_9EURY|nr:flavodoxin family protein [Methanoculleus sp. CWC-02]MCM2466012.1 flavodoxin family protein [Methanoculleus sp. CWC-02]
MTKVIAINGSPRRDGNTSILMRHIIEELEKEGITTEEVNLGGCVARGCTACMKCRENQDGHCVFDDDTVNTCIDKMVEADGIILGSPVYFLDVTAEMKGLIDRAGFVAMANRDLFQRKVGVAVTVMRRAGATAALNTMINFMVFSGMIIPGKPVIGLGREIGAVNRDEEGIGRAHDTGKNMAWLLKALEASRES